MPEWTLVDEWEGGKTYVDTSEIARDGNRCTAWILYDLSRPADLRGTDMKATQMINLEEYDFDTRKFRLHRIRFTFLDGSSGEPVTPVPEWAPATGGNETLLDFLFRRE